MHTQTRSASFATLAMSRAQKADHIAAGHPSQVSYEVQGKAPPHLYRAGSVDAALVRAEHFRHLDLVTLGVA